jgi:hypothetical protein
LQNTALVHDGEAVFFYVRVCGVRRHPSSLDFTGTFWHPAAIML